MNGNFIYGLSSVVIFNADTGIPIASAGSGSSISTAEGRTINTLMDNTGRPIDYGEGDSQPEVSLTLREYAMFLPFFTDKDNDGSQVKSSAEFNITKISEVGDATAVNSVAGAETSATTDTLVPGSYILNTPDGTAFKLYSLSPIDSATNNTADELVVAEGSKSGELVLTATDKGFTITLPSAQTYPAGFSVRIDVIKASDVFNEVKLLTAKTRMPLGITAISEKTGNSNQAIIYLHKVIFNSFPSFSLNNKEASEFEATGIPLVHNGDVGFVRFFN